MVTSQIPKPQRHGAITSIHIHIYHPCRVYKCPYYISSLSIFLGINALWRLVPLCCPTKALETISCRVIETTHILAASLPGGPFLAWISRLVSFTSTQRLWSWVPQSPWPLEEDLGIPLGHMLPSSRGLQWAARTQFMLVSRLSRAAAHCCGSFSRSLCSATGEASTVFYFTFGSLLFLSFL